RIRGIDIMITGGYLVTTRVSEDAQGATRTKGSEPARSRQQGEGHTSLCCVDRGGRQGEPITRRAISSGRGARRLIGPFASRATHLVDGRPAIECTSLRDA